MSAESSEQSKILGDKKLTSSELRQLATHYSMQGNQMSDLDPIHKQLYLLRGSVNVGEPKSFSHDVGRSVAKWQNILRIGDVKITDIMQEAVGFAFGRKEIAATTTPLVFLKSYAGLNLPDQNNDDDISTFVKRMVNGEYSMHTVAMSLPYCKSDELTDAKKEEMAMVAESLHLAPLWTQSQIYVRTLYDHVIANPDSPMGFLQRQKNLAQLSNTCIHGKPFKICNYHFTAPKDGFDVNIDSPELSSAYKRAARELVTKNVPMELFDVIFTIILTADQFHKYVPNDRSIAGAIEINYDDIQGRYNIVLSAFLCYVNFMVTQPAIVCPSFNIQHPLPSADDIIAACQKNNKEKVPVVHEVYHTADQLSSLEVIAEE